MLTSDMLQQENDQLKYEITRLNKILGGIPKQEEYDHSDATWARESWQTIMDREKTHE
jgi:hypothetical protein